MIEYYSRTFPENKLIISKNDFSVTITAENDFGEQISISIGKDEFSDLIDQLNSIADDFHA